VEVYQQINYSERVRVLVPMCISQAHLHHQEALLTDEFRPKLSILKSNVNERVVSGQTQSELIEIGCIKRKSRKMSTFTVSNSKYC
jgi:hypothetical protein